MVGCGKHNSPGSRPISRATRDSRMWLAWLGDRGIRSLCVVPATTALRKLGALAFGSRMEAAYSEIDVIFLQQVARQVAVALDNALNFEQAQSVQQQLKEERDRLSLLLEVNNAVVSVLDLHELLNAVSASLRRLVAHEYASISLYDAETQTLQIHALDFPVSKGLLKEGLSVPVEGSPTGRAITTRQPVLITRSDIEQFGSDIAQRILGEGLRSAYCLPLISHDRPLGTLVVGQPAGREFSAEGCGTAAAYRQSNRHRRGERAVLSPGRGPGQKTQGRKTLLAR